MPLLSTFGAASATSLGFGSSSGEAYWILQVGNSSATSFDNYLGAPMDLDSNGNIYVNMTTQNLSPGNDYDPLILSIAPDGTLNWSKLYYANGDSRGRGCQLDSSGNLYCTGQMYDSTDGYGHRGFTLSLDSSDGSLNWAKNHGASGSDGDKPCYSIAVASNGNNYVSGIRGYSSDSFLYHRNSSGTKQKVHSIQTGDTDECTGLAMNVSDTKVVWVGETQAHFDGSVIPSAATVWNFNASDFAIDWKRGIGFATTQAAANYGSMGGVDTDSSNNIYLCGRFYNDGVGNQGFVCRITSNGGFVHMRRFSHDWRFRCIAHGGDGYYYAAARDYSSNPDVLIISKHSDSNGAVSWVRKFQYAGTGNNDIRSIKVVNDIIYAFGYQSDSTGSSTYWHGHVYKYPSDGSITGTYGNWTISSVSATSDDFTPHFETDIQTGSESGINDADPTHVGTLASVTPSQNALTDL